MAVDLGSAFFQLVPSMRGFSAAVTRELGGSNGVGVAAGRSVGRQFSGGFTSFIGGGAIAGAIGGITAAATNALGRVIETGFAAAKGSVIDFNAQLEQSQLAFTTMLGSATKATDFISNLKTFARNTPFSFPEVVTASQRLLAMGIEAKKVIPYMTGIGDAVAGLGGGADKVNQVVTAIGQINAKGRVQGDEILQLTEAGIPALKILADSYGVTTGQISKMITAGKVASDKAIPALIQGFEKGTKSVKGFGGLMEAQSQTFTGAVSNISDSLNQSLAEAFKPFFNIVRDGAVEFAKFTQTKEFQAWANGVGDAVAGLAEKLKPLGKLISDIVTGKGIDTKSPIGAILQPIIDKLKQIPNDAGQSFQDIGAALKKAMPDMVTFATVVGPPLVQVLDDAVRLAGLLAPAIGGLSPVLVPLAGAFAGILAVSPVSMLRNTFDLMSSAQDPAQKLQGALTGQYGTFSQFAAKFGLAMSQSQGSILAFVAVARIKLMLFANSAAAAVGLFVARFQDGMSKFAINAVAALARFVRDVVAFRDRVGAVALNAGRAIVSNFVSGIRNGIGSVGSAMADMVKYAVDHLPNSPAKRGPLSGSGWTRVGKSGVALAAQFTSGFNTGIRDFASTVGGIVPDTLSSSVAGTITNASKTAGVSVVVSDRSGLLAQFVNVQIGKNTENATTTQRLGYQAPVFG